MQKALIIEVIISGPVDSSGTNVTHIHRCVNDPVSLNYLVAKLQLTVVLCLCLDLLAVYSSCAGHLNLPRSLQ